MNYRKKGFLVIVGIMCLAMLCSAAFGGQRIVKDLEITAVVTALDRNGNEYTRLIVQESKKIQGVEFDVGVPAMAFGSMNDKAKELKIGDKLNAVVSERSFNGRDSMTILKFLE